MWVAAAGNRKGGAVRRGNAAPRAGESTRCNGRGGVSSPAIIAQGLICIRWRMVEWRARKDTGQACACPVSRTGSAWPAPGAGRCRQLFLDGTRIAATELVDATADVQRLLLAGVERVRMAGDIHLDQRVL